MMHNTSIHDPKKPNTNASKSMNQVMHENRTKSLKKDTKSLEPREGNQHNHECFHTTRGLILYKIMKKM
jgi:hypothetical protein